MGPTPAHIPSTAPVVLRRLRRLSWGGVERLVGEEGRGIQQPPHSRRRRLPGAARS